MELISKNTYQLISGGAEPTEVDPQITDLVFPDYSKTPFSERVEELIGATALAGVVWAGAKSRTMPQAMVRGFVVAGAAFGLQLIVDKFSS